MKYFCRLQRNPYFLFYENDFTFELGYFMIVFMWKPTQTNQREKKWYASFNVYWKYRRKIHFHF